MFFILFADNRDVARLLFENWSAVLWTVMVFYVVFIVGLIGFAYSPHLLGALIFIELNLLAWGVVLAFMGSLYGSASGWALTIALISLGAAEAVVGLGFVIAMVVRRRGDEFSRLRFLRAIRLWNSLEQV